MLPLDQIICGDCREVMRSFPPESIDINPDYCEIARGRLAKDLKKGEDKIFTTGAPPTFGRLDVGDDDGHEP